MMHRTSIVGILQLNMHFSLHTTSTCCGNGPAHQPTPPLSLFMQSRESQQHACPTDFGPATVAFLDRQMRLQQPGHHAQPSGNERAGPAAPPQRNPSTRPSVWRLPSMQSQQQQPDGLSNGAIHLPACGTGTLDGAEPRLPSPSRPPAHRPIGRGARCRHDSSST